MVRVRVITYPHNNPSPYPPASLLPGAHLPVVVIIQIRRQAVWVSIVVYPRTVRDWQMRFLVERFFSPGNPPHRRRLLLCRERRRKKVKCVFKQNEDTHTHMVASGSIPYTVVLFRTLRM